MQRSKLKGELLHLKAADSQELWNVLFFVGKRWTRYQVGQLPLPLKVGAVHLFVMLGMFDAFSPRGGMHPIYIPIIWGSSLCFTLIYFFLAPGSNVPRLSEREMLQPLKWRRKGK